MTPVSSEKDTGHFTAFSIGVKGGLGRKIGSFQDILIILFFLCVFTIRVVIKRQELGWRRFGLTLAAELPIMGTWRGWQLKYKIYAFLHKFDYFA